MSDFLKTGQLPEKPKQPAPDNLPSPEQRKLSRTQLYQRLDIALKTALVDKNLSSIMRDIMEIWSDLLEATTPAEITLFEGTVNHQSMYFSLYQKLSLDDKKMAFLFDEMPLDIRDKFYDFAVNESQGHIAGLHRSAGTVMTIYLLLKKDSK